MGKTKQDGETIREMDTPPNCAICEWCDMAYARCKAIGFNDCQACHESQSCILLYKERKE